jgi:hypothetical protein
MSSSVTTSWTTIVSICSDVSSYLWKKPSMAPSAAKRRNIQFHEIDRRKRQGFSGSITAASGGGLSVEKAIHGPFSRKAA